MDPTPTLEPTATLVPTATLEPTATITPIPAVDLDFSGITTDAANLLGDVTALGNDGQLQYLILSFGGLLIGYALLYFIVRLVRAWRDD